MRVLISARFPRALIFLFALGTLPVLSQENGPTPPGGITGGKEVEIPSLSDTGITLDGNLDDAVWRSAALVTDLHQMAPFEYAQPSQRTEVRLFYSDDALYVAARLFEEDPSLITANVLLQGQGLPNDDTFNVMLDPYLDRRSGFIFEINANSVRVEGIYQNVSGVDRNWSGIWQAESRVDDQGWSTEIRIPFQTLSFDPSNTGYLPHQPSATVRRCRQLLL